MTTLLQPMLRAGELVEAVPGMVATQHAGTGKANQYFIAGLIWTTEQTLRFLLKASINMRSHGMVRATST